MATIDIWLFGKPEWEMDFNDATPQDIKDLGEMLMGRLGRISEIVEKLENNGWRRSAGLYNLFLHKNIKKELVGKELKKLGIGEKEVSIEDFGEEGLVEKEEEKIVG
jgi:hypothetical protein